MRSLESIAALADAAFAQVTNEKRDTPRVAADTALHQFVAIKRAAIGATCIHFRCEKGPQRLVFNVDCAISAYALKNIMAADGWQVVMDGRFARRS